MDSGCCECQVAFDQFSIVVLQPTVDPKGLPGQQEDATGTVRSKKPSMVALSKFHSLSQGHVASRGVNLHTGIVWFKMALAPTRAGAMKTKERMVKERVGNDELLMLNSRI